MILLISYQKNYLYIQRFSLVVLSRKQSFFENPESRLVCLTDTFYPRLEIEFGGSDAYREKLEIDAESFIGLKSFKARGKRVTTWQVASVTELEPLRFPEVSESESDEEDTISSEEEQRDKSDVEIIDEITGQGSLFSEEEQE